MQSLGSEGGTGKSGKMQLPARDFRSLQCSSGFQIPDASVVDLGYCWLGWEVGKSCEEVEKGGEAAEAFGMVGKAEEVVEAGDGEVVGGGSRGRRWEGWAAGCGMGIDGDQLAARIRSLQVGDTSEQGKQH